MKRLIIFSFLMTFGMAVFAQNDSKVKSLESKIAKSDAAIQDAKKGIDPGTWMSRGDLFYEVYGYNVHSVRQGQPALELKIVFGDPKQVVTSQDGATDTYEYSRIKVNVDKALGTVVSWVETAVIDPKALEKALAAYQKAASLDQKGKLKKKLAEAYTRLANDFEQKEFNAYALKQYLNAYNDAQMRIQAMAENKVQDTASYYYSGYFSYMAYPSRTKEDELKLAKTEEETNVLNNVVNNFQKAMDLNFKEEGANQGLMYGMLYSACCALSDTAKGLAYLEKGFSIYPENQTLVLTLLNHYVLRNQSQKALDFVNKAKALDKSNDGMLDYVEGRMLDMLNRRDESVAAYDRAIAQNPKRYEFYYNKGVVYFNHAVKLLDEAGNAPMKEYEKLKEAADDEFERAVEPMEKALELKPDDQTAMETLKTLYFRLRVRHPEMEAKAKALDEKLKAMGVEGQQSK